MNLFKDNKEIFNNIMDLYYKFEEYGYVFEGHRSEELQQELLKINDSMNKIEEILDDNYGI